MPGVAMTVLWSQRLETSVPKAKSLLFSDHGAGKQLLGETDHSESQQDTSGEYVTVADGYPRQAQGDFYPV